MTIAEKVRSLIRKSNQTTGKNDANLTSAVLSLVAGYGAGGDTPIVPSGDGVFTEIFGEKWKTVTIQTEIKNATELVPLIQFEFERTEDLTKWQPCFYFIVNNDPSKDLIADYISGHMWALYQGDTQLSLHLARYRGYTGKCDYQGFTMSPTAQSTAANRNIGIHAGATLDFYRVPYTKIVGVE